MSDDEEDSNVNLENGYYSAGHTTEGSDSELDLLEIEDVPSGPARDFDTDIPTTHQYLGPLENIRRYTVFEENMTHNMLAMFTNTLVFPGFTLPLVLNGGEFDINYIYEDLKEGYSFVLTCLNKTGTDVFEYGVVMEVFENSMSTGSINLKAKGRQRCSILKGQRVSPTWGRLNKINVQVLPEPSLLAPNSDSQLLTLRQRQRGSWLWKDGTWKYRKYHMAQFPFPSWVYDNYDVHFLVKHIVKTLCQFYFKENLPTDPVALSYWFVQNFQLTHEERLNILACNTALERLRLELEYLKLKRVICCGRCKVDITGQNNVFAMSKDGVQSNYCNPGGVVYETVTVSSARNFALEGPPSRQYSWFPGYAWTIMKCNVCKSHLGWQFTSRHLQPFVFYGLANRSLEFQVTTEESKVK